jgi:hypothetical protein
MLQQANLIPAMSITMPSCANYYFKTFDWLNFEEDEIAICMRYVICTECCEEEMRPPTYNMYKAGYEQVNILYNMADMISITFLAFGIVPIISVIVLLLPNSKIA